MARRISRCTAVYRMKYSKNSEYFEYHYSKKLIAMKSNAEESVFEARIAFDRHGKVISANTVLLKITGYTGRSLLGSKIHTLIHHADRRQFRQYMEDAQFENARKKFTIRLSDARGRTLTIFAQLRSRPHDLADQKLAMNFIVIPAGSSSGAKSADGQLKDTLAEAIFSGTTDGPIRYANRSFLKIFGYRSSKRLPALSELTADEKDYKSILRKMKKDGEVTDRATKLRRKNGDEVWARLTIFPDPPGERPGGYSGVVTPIDRQAAANRRIDAAHSSILSAVLDSARDQILALDSGMRYIMFNHAHAKAIRGLTGGDIRVGDKFLESLPTDLVTLARRELRQAFAAGRHVSEIPLPNKTILKTSFHAIRDENNKMTGVAIFAEDISERKKTELKLKALNEELTAQNWQLAMREEDLKMAMDQLSERNFELDQLMYKTSHDLRSPLSSILGLVNLANLDPDPGNLTQYLKKIEGRIKKLDEFISSMVNYARVNRGEITVGEIDLERTVRALIHELEYLDNFAAVRTEIQVNKEAIPFRNDHFLMKIIAGNVISNAYKYYNPEADSYLRIVIDVGPASATIEFSDNGIGIRKEHQDKIFDMFYRATDRSQGSGLGMYIVRQAIEKIDGTIGLKSTYGTGTTIKIVIPNL